MFTIIGADGKEYGPVTADQIREWIGQNRLTLDMQARLTGEAEWRRLRDFPEFAPPAATTALPPPLAAAPGAGPAATTSSLGAAPSGPQPIVFTGEWTEYFKIWIVNVLLTIVTLGIYAAWAKVRRRRYFYSNTSILGHTLEYLADPVKILYGNLIVVALFLTLTLLGVVSPLLQLPFVIAFAIAVPWFIVRALAFNARNTAWRGLRFNFSGTYGESAKVFFLWPLLVAPTLGLIFPFVAKKQKTFIVERHAFGTAPFSFAGTTEGFYKIYGIAALFFLPLIAVYFAFIITMTVAAARNGGQPDTGALAALGSFGLLLFLAVPLAIVGTFYFRSRMFNYMWSHTTLAGTSFEPSMRARDLLLLHVVNSIVTALTLGFLHPWAAVRNYKFHVDSLQIAPAGDLDAFVAAAHPPGSAIGEAADDFFDFDIGFGV
jgi:uncharacterized membrane protein YjgN (DUF898 family)